MDVMSEAVTVVLQHLENQLRFQANQATVRARTYISDIDNTNPEALASMVASKTIEMTLLAVATAVQSTRLNLPQGESTTRNR